MNDEKTITLIYFNDINMFISKIMKSLKVLKKLS